MLRLNFTQLRRRVELEAHRRFFFALLLHDVYREGTAYQSVMRRQVNEPVADYRFIDNTLASRYAGCRINLRILPDCHAQASEQAEDML